MTIKQAMEILTGLNAEQLALLSDLLPWIEAARPRTESDPCGEPPERCPN